MDKEEFYKIAKIIEIEIQSGKNYSQCIGMGYFTERFNDAWEQVKKLNKPAVSNNEVGFAKIADLTSLRITTTICGAEIVSKKITLSKLIANGWVYEKVCLDEL